jgi:hypothetical protein
MRPILALRYSYFITILQQNIGAFVFDVNSFNKLSTV